MKPEIQALSASEQAVPSASAAKSRGSNELTAKASRRRFSLRDKRRIVGMAQNLPDGEIGALLRRELLYSPHPSAWRQQVAALNAATPEPKRALPMFRSGH